ncbi:hypothetical protein ACTFQF_22000 [Aliivibrio fischeri]|uniref:hypothetical protein n=1 Tax=Aliivibrio fischeri TaxID=668 RepID=UPI0007C4D577|nr:hypothetical protein [Aliivibrio fischeri]MBP3140051.1 hypothetical protein [Aliivibrio fischeri]MBP3154432.1 hypothetical protein [Aliivibrio fischeri]
MKINHNFALIGALLFTLTTVGCGSDTKTEAERLYNRNLDFFVKGTEFRGRDINRTFPSLIPLIIPENPVLDKWNQLYSQPQIMFHYGEDSTIYIMNMNGTDVRLLLHRDELGKLPAPTGFTQRSNTGRYLLLDYYGMAGTRCAVFDLENREIVSDVKACHGAEFSQDDRYFYYINTGSKFYPHRVDLETKVTTDVLPDEVVVDGQVFYPQGDTGSFTIDEANDRFIWSLSSDIARKQADLPRTVVFRLSDMKLLGRQEYLPENCESGNTYHMDKRYFVCGRDNETYLVSDPMTLVENAPYDEMIQRGKWYMDSDGSKVYRYKQPGENGMFDKIKYNYRIMLKGSKDYADYKLPGKFSAYLPPNLADDFDNMDLGVFFPAIPTQTQYQEAYQRVLKERKEANNGK